MTGMLIADCIDRREFRADATLGDISNTLPVALHTIRLDQLGTHTSGLPTLPGSLRMRLRTIAFAFLGTDPFRGIRPQKRSTARIVKAIAARDADLAAQEWAKLLRRHRQLVIAVLRERNLLKTGQSTHRSAVSGPSRSHTW